MPILLAIGILAAGLMLAFFLGTMWLLRVRADIFSSMRRTPR
jgi:hypothetical protein